MKINSAVPPYWLKIKTIDLHTAGEPLRVILKGFPPLKGNTILEKRRYIKENLDHLRKRLMWEPRGHSDMYGALITPPEKKDSDLGVLFMHNEGYSTMCGHGIIALTKLVFDTGIIRKKGDNPVLKIDSPAGLITATAHREKGMVKSVSFLNVPSFIYKADQTIEVAGLGKIKYTIAFGGAFYAYCTAEEAQVDLQDKDYNQLIRKGRKIKKAVMDSLKIIHPLQKDLGFLYGIIFTGKPEDPANHSRNVCVFADGELDRSPTGTGVSGRAAIHYFNKEIALNQEIAIESILGTVFKVKAVKEEKFAQYDAVIPSVKGEAFITGINEFYFDPHDPLKNGFIFR